MADVARPDGVPASLSVSIRHGRLSFGATTLFEGLDVHLEAGCVTALLGPSGVGKTTLLRVLAGLSTPEPPTRVTTGDGLPLTGRVAYMAQQDLLLPWLDVQENVLLGPTLRRERRTPAVLDQVRSLLDRVGLAGREGERPSALSGGERQRVALARTLMEDRPVVLMDEPFSALDAISRLRVQNLAGGLLSGRTVLLVTHDPLEALRLAHRVHVMAGRPARIGPALIPPGAPPRTTDDIGVLALQGELLRRLAG